MPRVLQCLDPVPAADGSCASQAWVEQPSLVDMLPTVEQANAVGFAVFASVAIVASLAIFRPSLSDPKD